MKEKRGKNQGILCSEGLRSRDDQKKITLSKLRGKSHQSNCVGGSGRRGMEGRGKIPSSTFAQKMR